MQRPKVIFLDAVNTLFGVKGSVGELYSDMAKQFGVEVSAVALEREFIKSFQAAPPPMFPGIEPQNIQISEFNWWHSVSLHTFAQVGVLHQFSDFSAFFTQLYTYFATAEPWFVYPDVYPVLKRWQQLEIELGVLSNFDSRLYSVLEALDLSQFFTSITISTEVGAAKPDPQIFEIALKKHNISAQSALHIGDSWQEDYQGANAAGLKAIWLQRKEQA